jgi:hypothetical protein
MLSQMTKHESHAVTPSHCSWPHAKLRGIWFAGGELARARAWSYEHPTPEFEGIRGHLSFYAFPFECWVDGERVEAQPGSFYGGWITSDIDGGKRGFKGPPGTWGW